MNTKQLSFLPTALATFFIALLLSTISHAQGNYKAISNSQLDVDIEELNYILLPLTQAELEIEATAWRDELSKMVYQLSSLEIKSQQIGHKAKLLDQAADQLEELVEARKSDDTEAILDAKNALKESGDELEVAPEKIKEITEQADLAFAEKVSDKSIAFEDEKSAMTKQIASLKLEQGRMIKRFSSVLDALESKGGDVKEFRLYADAVSGIQINVEDTSTAWLVIAEWIKSEDGGGILLINLLKFIVAITLVILLSKLSGHIADRITRHNSVSQLLENFIKVAARRTVLIIGIIMTLPIVGINIGPVMALIGAAGLVVGLALQGTLSNFASGVLILIYRPYDINDVIEVGIGGVTGIVNSMTLLCTTIKTLDNKLITVPNNNVWNDAITNITGSAVRRVDLVFGISYSDDFTIAQKIMKKILEDHPKVLSKPASMVRVHELADSSVNFICRPWVKTEDYWDVYWDITETVKQAFDAQGVSIPFPQRDVHLFPAGELLINQANQTATELETKT